MVLPDGVGPRVANLPVIRRLLDVMLIGFRDDRRSIALAGGSTGP